MFRGFREKTQDGEHHSTNPKLSGLSGLRVNLCELSV